MSQDFPVDFHPAIITWFQNKFGEPTQPQRLGWPLVSSGKNTLILAPTGSGKTLAAFLAGINRVVSDLEAGTGPESGVEILYISPLKALNYDIERNLVEPLAGIQQTALEMGRPLPEIRTAVRTGDTPADERRRMARKPPHILITTPESLHLILTSSPRSMLQTVRYVIVDEIHSLSPNKRGVFLATLLERLEDICHGSPVRIGLSATQKPLSEVASFLGGFSDSGEPRPVEIVDTGVLRRMDLQVICASDDLRNPDEGSVWPPIFRRLLELVQSHGSTIIFANTRRIVEKLTLGINDLAGEELVRPHHGSVSAPLRRRTEAALKNGDLKGVVATGTLELGIDMGAVELVCQVESPKEVSRGLQRVGRAGHVMTAISKGRIIPKTNADLMEAVSVAKGMLDGDVEPISVPKNCLDVLAQQIVAMAALEGTSWIDVYRTVRRTYSFHDLSEEAFNLTLQLVSGRYPSKAFRDLRPRVSLDRVSGRISPLPGAQRLVISNGGAIPDTGQYGVYLSEANLKIGELDEEFVYESREGDTFSLGTNNWKIQKIEADRILVSHGSPFQARMPFWRGENVPRSARTGRRMGELMGQIAEKGEDAEEWVLDALPVDSKAAGNIANFIDSQSGEAENPGLPTDKRIVLETFADDIGGRRLAVITVFGGRVHHALRIALSALMQKELGIEPETVVGDNGVLFRLPEGDAPPPLGLLRRLTPELAYDLIVDDLPNTALFGLRFRQNAARALLLPGAGPGKRTPLWLQRLKAKDLLAIAKLFDGFPIIVETFRECLQDYLELDELREILRQVQSGEIEISIVERLTPSPLASTMLFNFQMIYQYEWDQPKSVGMRRSSLTERRLVDELVDGKLGRALDERAISDLDNLLQGIGERYRARTAEEFYELVRRLGDVPEEDASSRCADPDFIQALLEEGKLVEVTFANARRSNRLAACDHLDEYLRAISGEREAIESILDRHIANRSAVSPADIAADYGFPASLVESFIQSLMQDGQLIEIPPAPGAQSPRYISPGNLEIIYRRTLAMQKLEAKPATPQMYTEFLTRWQHLHPNHRLQGQDGLRVVLRQLEALWLPYSIWEPDVLARRVSDFRPEQIDDLSLSAEFVWMGQSAVVDRPGSIAFLAREGLSALHPLLRTTSTNGETTAQKDAVRHCLETHGASFLIDIVAETGLDSRIVQRLLWEMIWSGEVTHDYFKLLRSGKPPAVPEPKPQSEHSHHADRRQFYRARTRIRKTFSHPTGHNPGRWTLLSALARHEVDQQESLEIYARILLERYGVVAKDIVQRTGEPDVLWGNLYNIYQRMELSGEIERGYFVEGLAGAQFGLPEAVDDLMSRRGVGSLDIEHDRHPILLNACDPAYLYSSAGPFDTGFGRLNRLPSNYAVLLNGQPVLTVELGSGTLNTLDGLASEDAAISAAALKHLMDNAWPIRPYRRVELRNLGSDPVVGSPAEELLRSVGFEKDGDRMIMWSVER